MVDDPEQVINILISVAVAANALHLFIFILLIIYNLFVLFK